MKNLNSTFLDSQATTRPQRDGLNVQMSIDTTTKNLPNSNRNSKLIYLNPNDALNKCDTNYVSNMLTSYQMSMNKTLSTASSSPNHYSTSSTSSRISSGDDSSSSSECQLSNQSTTYAVPPDLSNQSPYGMIQNNLNGSIYQTLKQIDTSTTNQGPNYLQCIDKLMDQNELGRKDSMVMKNQPIYSNKTDMLTRNRYKNYEDQSQLAADFSRLNKNSVSFRTKPDNNQKLLSELLRTSQTGTLRPVPPSRTSSLQYRQRTMHPSASLFIYKKSQNCNSNSSSDGDESSAILENSNPNVDDSIYSSFSLRMSRLSSFNLGSNENKKPVVEEILNKSDQFRIESFYKSIGSSVYSSKCACEFYTTDLQCLIKLLDWQHQFSGVPVWIFNTGLNPKRPKGLSLVIADKKTGFANLRLNNISHDNDLKWTKPGHLTLKVYPKNLSECTGNEKSPLKKSTRNRSSKESKNSANFVNTRRNSLTNQNFNAYSELMNKLSLGCDKEKFIFAAIRFGNEFECSKFYDFYRNLFVDSQNDDLFNPHYSRTPNKINMMKIFLKKITKSSISSPVAFQHVNSLSMGNENLILGSK